LTYECRFDTQRPEQEPSIFRRIELQCDFSADDFVTRQEFFHSADGTRIPMFVVHKKGLRLDGSNPTLLYGYGGESPRLSNSVNVETPL